jgi:hypothetical protein
VGHRAFSECHIPAVQLDFSSCVRERDADDAASSDRDDDSVHGQREGEIEGQQWDGFVVDLGFEAGMLN